MDSRRKCLWDNHLAVAIWVCRYSHNRIPLCPNCLQDWTLRAGQSRAVAEVLGYEFLEWLPRAAKSVAHLLGKEGVAA